MAYADGRYNYRPWDKRKPPQEINATGPFASVSEQRISQSLSVATIPGNMLAEIVTPPLPQVQRFRPKYGYRTRELTINDIINVDQMFDVDGTPMAGDKVGPGYEGTTRNVQVEGTW